MTRTDLAVAHSKPISRAAPRFGPPRLSSMEGLLEKAGLRAPAPPPLGSPQTEVLQPLVLRYLGLVALTELARKLETADFNGFWADVEKHADLVGLVPGAQSACPHVALCVVPRQMVEHGDPGRRGTDHSESYGASIKDGIHRRCLRRRLNN